jgi:hypothetical protein
MVRVFISNITLGRCPYQKKELQRSPNKSEDFRRVQKDLNHRSKLIHCFQEPENAREIPRLSPFVLSCLYVYDCLLDIFQGAEFEVFQLSLGESRSKIGDDCLKDGWRCSHDESGFLTTTHQVKTHSKWDICA